MSTAPLDERFETVVESIHALPILSDTWKRGRLDGRYNKKPADPPAPRSKEEPHHALYLAGFLLGLKEREDFVQCCLATGRHHLNKQLRAAGVPIDSINGPKNTLELIQRQITVLWKNMDKV